MSSTDLAIAAIKAQALWDAGEQLRRQAAELHPEFARRWANEQIAWSAEDWQMVKDAAKEARGEMGKGMAAAFRADFPWSAKLAERFAKEEQP